MASKRCNTSRSGKPDRGQLDQLRQEEIIAASKKRALELVAKRDAAIALVRKHEQQQVRGD